MAAFIELADIRHSARMDPVPLAGVAADDLETALFGELLALARRQPLPATALGIGLPEFAPCRAG